MPLMSIIHKPSAISAAEGDISARRARHLIIQHSAFSIQYSVLKKQLAVRQSPSSIACRARHIAAMGGSLRTKCDTIVTACKRTQ